MKEGAARCGKERKKMQIIEVHTKSRPSEVYCGAGALEEARRFLKDKDVFVVTDENVAKIYADRIGEWFPKAVVCTVKAGERRKNRGTLFQIIDKMLEAQLHRNSVVAALGGGVIGDMAGFAASVYMRGTRIVQIPTTLLAQVDSSVGGKTAIDYGGVKNVLGAFYQPERVFCDPLFLQTLPPREVRCGLGEIIKTGVLDAKIGDRIAENASEITDLTFLREIVADCVRFKAEIVARDETESSGLRKCLNLGHTTGHALELAYGRRSHGEYVLIGMWLESLIAEREGVCTPAWAEHVRKLVSLAEKKIPTFENVRSVLRFALLDKKNAERGSVSMILPKCRGKYGELVLSAERYAEYLGLLQERRA